MEATDERRRQGGDPRRRGCRARAEARKLEERVRELERLLGRKTMEVEILKEALDLARVKKPTLLSRLPTREDSHEDDRETLEVARSNIIERAKGDRRSRGPQIRPGDVELAADIRRLVDQRPTYGYRRIAALLKRERRSAGQEPVNAKRVYRLMRKHGLLLQRHTGRRRPRQHDGQVIAIRSNIRWCSDALEFTCWNGEIIRLAFALDCHDREVIGWLATTDGISAEMIRDMMLQCVERRFATFHASHRVQWLTHNGSIFALTRRSRSRRSLEPCSPP